MFKLRDYQVRQLDFVTDKLKTNRVVSVQSPTGSGKSITMMQIAKDWMENEEHNLDNTVVISTGFNHLVFQLAKTAREFGLNPTIVLGRRAVNCPILMKKAGVPYQAFTENSEFVCNGKHDRELLDRFGNCKATGERYSEAISTLHSTGNLVITNHSMLCVSQTVAKLIIIDEAHTFANFYESSMKFEINEKELQIISAAIDRLDGLSKAVVINSLKRQRPVIKQVPKIQENIISFASTPIQKEVMKQIANKAQIFLTSESTSSNYIDADEKHFELENFYSSFDLSAHVDAEAKIVLFSATVDRFTQKMFGVKGYASYIESQGFVDYRKSEFLGIVHDDFSESLTEFMTYVNLKSLKNGLILSTTISDMRVAFKMAKKIKDGYSLFGYRVFRDLDQFKNDKSNDKKVLIGSRALFQGIDIPDLEFVAINKIPFPVYSEKEQKREIYLESSNPDFRYWSDFVVPKTENDIIQTTGRLWRSSDSRGVVSVFDKRINRFSYMFKYTMSDIRRGIKLKIAQKDKSDNWNIDEFENAMINHDIESEQKKIKVKRNLMEGNTIYD